MISGVSKLHIFNIALGFIGTRIVDNEDEKSPEAIQCNLYWDRARRSVLRDYPYDFAIRRYQPEAMTVPATYQGWSYCYQAPLNALKVWSVHTPGDYVTRQPFEVAYLDDNIIILCNVANAHITCAVDVTNLALWSEQFVTAMARKLALLISNALLKNNPQKIQELNALYEAALPEKWQEENWAVVGSSARLDIYNQALGLVGARMISSLAENVPEAVQCGLYWDRARRSVLRDYPFRFAVRRVALTARDLPSTYSGDWTHCYRCPADTLKVLSLHNGTDKQTRQPFAIEYLDDSDAILCNVAGAQATYTADVEDTSRWDEKFTAAMATKLALLIAPSLIGGEASGKVRELAELYNSSIPKSLEWEEGGWATTNSPERLNICNIALGYIGANMISSTTENVPEAVQCNLYWDRARRSVLRDFPFRFAIHREALVSTALPSSYGGDWNYCYQYPKTALRVLSVHAQGDKETRQAFAIEYKSDRTLLLCNVVDAEATFVADVPDLSVWDEKFTNAMSHKLALMICGSIVKDQQVISTKMEALGKLYAASLPGEVLQEEQWAVPSEADRLGIYNMALGFAGCKMVSSVTENTPEAVQCSLHWDRARRSVLRDYPYLFATRNVKLSRHELPVEYVDEWEYCFSAPKDSLRILSVHKSTDRVNREEYSVEYIGNEMLILCNVSDAHATCIMDIVNIALWDERFIAAMSYKLAFMICRSLFDGEKDISSKLQELLSLYESSLPGEKIGEDNWAASDDKSRLNIYNMALGFIGANMISSVSEKSKEAVQCTLFWDRARRSALRDFPYSFSQKRFFLEYVDVPEEYFGHWAYGYSVPEGVLKVNKVASRSCCEPYRIPFVIEQIDGSPTILTDERDAVALCTIDVEDVEKWDDLFSTSMARKLSVMIAPSLYSKDNRGFKNVVSDLEELYARSVPEAEGADASERRDYREFDSWLAARCGYVERICRRKGKGKGMNTVHECKKCCLVNLKDFGAKGDGATDDTSAWSAWKAALTSGGLGYIPSGMYKVNGRVKSFPYGCIGQFGDGFLAIKPGFTNRFSNAIPVGQEHVVCNSRSVTVHNGNEGRSIYPTIYLDSEINVSSSASPVTIDDTPSGALISSCNGIHIQHILTGGNENNRLSSTGIVANAINDAIGDNDCSGIAARAQKTGDAGVGDTAGLGGRVDNYSHKQGGVMGAEMVCNNLVDGIPCPSDFSNVSTSRWASPLHITGSGGPSTAAILIQGSRTDPAYWDGIQFSFSMFPSFDSNNGSFKKNEIPGNPDYSGGEVQEYESYSFETTVNGVDTVLTKYRIPNTVAINMGSFSYTAGFPDTCIKMGKAKHHIWTPDQDLTVRSHGIDVSSFGSISIKAHPKYFTINNEIIKSNASFTFCSTSEDGTTTKNDASLFFNPETNSVGLHNFASNTSIVFYKPDMSNSSEDVAFFMPGMCTNNDGDPVASKVSLGSGGRRWENIYSKTSNFYDSDERLKQDIEDIPEAVFRAWGRVKFSKFRFSDAVAKKGDGARFHIGVIAQRVIESFREEGLDAFEYGIVGLDVVPAKEAVYRDYDINHDAELDEDCNVVREAWVEHVHELVTEGEPGSDIYLIRYEEALALECAYQRWRIQKIEERIGITL